MKAILIASLFFLLGVNVSAQEHTNARTVYAKGMSPSGGTSVKDTSSSERKSGGNTNQIAPTSTENKKTEERKKIEPGTETQKNVNEVPSSAPPIVPAKNKNIQTKRIVLQTNSHLKEKEIKK